MWLGDDQDMRMGTRVAGCDPPGLDPPGGPPSPGPAGVWVLPKRDFKRIRSSWLIRRQVLESVSLKIWGRG